MIVATHFIQLFPTKNTLVKRFVVCEGRDFISSIFSYEAKIRRIGFVVDSEEHGRGLAIFPIWHVDLILS